MRYLTIEQRDDLRDKLQARAEELRREIAATMQKQEGSATASSSV